MTSTKVDSWIPHGLALKAYWKGDKNAAINIHLEDGTITTMPIEIYFRTQKELPEIEKIALTLCQGSILDVGAGAGVHSLILQKKHNVTALDISADGAEVIKANGVTTVVCNDFLTYQPSKKFDTLLFLMNGIGVSGNLIGLEDYLQKAHTLTPENGQIILDSSDLRNGETELDFSQEYFGVFKYYLSFESTTGEPYQWLYIDQELLEEIALRCKWKTEVIYEQEDGSYLARLTKR